MHGLVAYDDDDQSDSEAGPSFTNGRLDLKDKNSKSASKQSSEARRMIKAQVVIKRPASHKNQHPRAHILDDSESAAALHSTGPSTQDGASPMDLSSTSSHAEPSEELQDELSRIRALLMPAPISKIDDWGIPAECTDVCDPALMAKLSQFSSLKKDSANPKHFNDSLMSNRSFRNPHLYTKLVEFVDVDERATNFTKDLWDPEDVKPDWFADQIGMFAFSVYCIVLFMSFCPRSRSLSLAPVLHRVNTAFRLFFIPSSSNSSVMTSAFYARRSMLWISFLQPLGCNSWVQKFKADAQKERSEKQAAAPSAGKRSHIDFSGSKEKEAPTGPRKSRFQPYSITGAASAKDRQKTRWG